MTAGSERRELDHCLRRCFRTSGNYFFSKNGGIDAFFEPVWRWIGTVSY
jgi:hypothetical protein